MQNKYLVGVAESEFGEGEFNLVIASSPEEAAEKFVSSVAISDEIFLEHVLDKSVNMSFASHFWLQTEAENEQFEESGELKINKEEFKKRVQNFFGEHRNYADLFIESYFADNDKPGISAEFPEEMLVYIWLNSNFSILIYRV